jgi:UDPglucose 6-dehydrogenase
MNITVIGTGYVGLVTGACFSKKGNQVYCVDIDEEKIEGLKRGVIPIFEPDLERIVIESQKSGDLIFTTNLKEAVDDSNIIFIAVGTPMNDDGSANLDHVLEAARNIGRTISHESLVVVKSTVPVGTSHEIQRIINEISEIEVDIASNPEFLREGRAVEDFMNPDRIVIGAENDKVFETLKELYQPFTSNHEQFILMDVESSELTKYVANALLATRISFMNEIANICEVTGTNIQDIQRGIGSDMRIGHDYLNAGCGYGGSCLPKDVNALIKMANSNDMTRQSSPKLKRLIQIKRTFL